MSFDFHYYDEVSQQEKTTSHKDVVLEFIKKYETIDSWLEHGILNGWVSDPLCLTHQDWTPEDFESKPVTDNKDCRYIVDLVF